MKRSHRTAVWTWVVIAGAVFGLGCHGDTTLGPPDSFAVYAPLEGSAGAPPRSAMGLALVTPLAPDDPRAAPLYRLTLPAGEATGLREPSQVMVDKIMAVRRDRCGAPIGRADDGTLLAKVVLRALARARGTEPPQHARARRELWEAAGVATDRVSSTVLTYGLAPLGDDWPARLLRERALAAAETHLTMRDLRRMEWRLRPGTEVFVCENPRVIEAAADGNCQRWLVCTAGNPATTVQVLLDALIAAGARLAYRGDFDWSGIAIANRMFSRYAARPWRMSATDYEEHTAAARDRGTPLQPLSGPPVNATWDAELTPAMSALGLAIQEESALELILADLL